MNWLTKRKIKPGARVVFIGIHGERNLKGTVDFIRGERIWVKWDRYFPWDHVGFGNVELAPPST